MALPIGSRGAIALVAGVLAACGARGESRPDADSPPLDTPPQWPPGSALTPVATGATSVAVEWSSAVDDVGVAGYVLRRDGTPIATLDDITTTAPVMGLLAGATVTFSIEATDTAGQTTPGPEVSYVVLPPDPGAIAVPVSEDIATEIGASTEFLYTGPDPIQQGVAPGTIDLSRVAVLRGDVRAGAAPLPGVTVTILDHPELGWTMTRADGMFDLVVNGGGPLTVVYRRDGYPTAQRHVDAPWQAYAFLPTVVLVPYDTAVTVIDLAAATDVEVARGNPVTDGDGTRQATLLFPPGTSAQMTVPGAMPVALDTISVRATEYSVGAAGPDAMPGTLPVTSAYTYAVELSVDEAIAAGATRVTFSQPVAFYVENFLGFPVGGAVPTGYYDRELGSWVASDDGRAVGVVSITGGLAELDVNGDGVADGAAALAALGIDDAERMRLATLYTAGVSLWRVSLTHFTPADLNWPFGPPPDAAGPAQQVPPPITSGDKDPPKKKCFEKASIIQCQDQTLGEEIPVSGTPFHLRYQSDRIGSRWNALTIPLTGDAPPASLARVDLEIRIAGQKIVRSFAPAPNLIHELVWDGRDGYGRRVNGRQPGTVRIAYIYPAVHYGYLSGAQGRAFARVMGPSGAGAALYTRTPPAVVLSQEWPITMGPFIPPSLGGWTLDVHHAYDTVDRAIYQGDGRTRRATGIGRVIDTVAGTGVAGGSGDGGPAAAARLDDPRYLDVDRDGAAYVADYNNHTIRKIDPSGIITTVAGTGALGFSGDGGPASAAALSGPAGIALGPDGSLYFVDSGNARIRRIRPDGIIETIAGNGTSGYTGDGGPAVLAAIGVRINAGLAVDPDGNVYFSCGSCEVVFNSHVIRRIDRDGIINTFAGVGSPGYWPEPSHAVTATRFYEPTALAFGPDRSLYVCDSRNQRVRRIGPDGMVTTIAGNGGALAGIVDGNPATNQAVAYPRGIAFDHGGSIYISTTFYNFTFPTGFYGRIVRVAPDGILTTVAGGNAGPGFSGDGGLARSAQIGIASGLRVAPDGALWIADNTNRRVRRSALALSAYSTDNRLIPSEDGEEAYRFDSVGRHLATVDGLTGAPRLSFAYDGAGRLASLTDGFGNTTTITRNPTGAPTEIVAPGGQITALSLDAAGRLAALTNPAGEAYAMTYAVTGLLATFANPRGDTSTFGYDDPLGRLIADTDPANGTRTLSRTDTVAGYTVTFTTPLGRATQHEMRTEPGGVRQRSTSASGEIVDALFTAAGSQNVVYPTGLVATSSDRPDPRWLMLAPRNAAAQLTTPGGRTVSVATTQAATVTDPADPFTVTTATQTATVNGRTYQAQAAVQPDGSVVHTYTSPSGRQQRVTRNPTGLVSSITLDPGYAPQQLSFDAMGQLTAIALGASTQTYTYDVAGRVTTTTDALGRTRLYSYDTADRIVGETLPGGAVWAHEYDAVGEPTKVTLPGGAAYDTIYDAAARRTTVVTPGGDTYVFQNDADGRPLAQTLPSGGVVAHSYDAAGRPTGSSYAEATTTATFAASGLLPSTLVRTPTAGLAQAIDLEYDAHLVTRRSFIGAATGDYRFRYDNDLRVVGVTLDAAPETPIARDADGFVIGRGVFSIVRNGPAAAATQITGASATYAIGYDLAGRLASRDHTVAGSPVYAEQILHDNASRVVQRTETLFGITRIWDYEYDLDSELVRVRRDGVVVEEYGYDARQNRVSRRIDGGPIVVSTFDLRDQLLDAGGVAHIYDLDGQLALRGSDGFVYSARGELLTATVGGSTISYAYDLFGRRVARTGAAGTVQYLYGDFDDDLRVTAVRDGAALIILSYDDAGRLHAMQRDGVMYHVASDLVGTPRVVVDTAGVAVKVIERDAFGVVTSDSNPAFFLPIGFAGGITDPVTGLVRLGRRDYDPATGRWTARDPLFFTATRNLYHYAGNSPVTLRDANGMFSVSVSVCGVVCAGVKVAVTKTGYSMCAEGGVGLGGSVEVDPVAGLDPNGDYTKVEAKAGVGPVGVGVKHIICPDGSTKTTPYIEAGPIHVEPGGATGKKSVPYEEGEPGKPIKVKGVEVKAKVTKVVCMNVDGFFK